MTVLNDSYTESSEFTLPHGGEQTEITLWNAADILPGSRFSPSKIPASENKITVPPLSLLTVCFAEKQ